MISFKEGNLLEDDALALVNTVNCVGIMGAGIAKMFKEKHPHNFYMYKRQCDHKQLKPSEVYLCRDNGKVVLNLATKNDWKDTSRISWIIKGCNNLKAVILENKIESVAIPAIGCNNGRLSWNTVKRIMEGALEGVPCDIRIYLPKD